MDTAADADADAGADAHQHISRRSSLLVRPVGGRGNKQV